MSISVIVAVALYCIVFPLVIDVVGRLHKKFFIDRRLEGVSAAKARTMDLPDPRLPVWRRRIRYTITDTGSVMFGRKAIPIPRWAVFWVLWVAGLVLAVMGGMASPMSWRLLVASFIVFIVSVVDGVLSSKKVLEARQKKIRTMTEIASKFFGYDDPKNVSVLAWDDPVTPSKVYFVVPSTFNEMNADAFLHQYNQVFGQQTTWVPYLDPQTGRPGWDYERGVLTLRANPPLPRSAAWNERYITNPAVAWSFFPLGIGVEHGLPIMNETTGETEQVIGFDVAGLEKDAAKQAGVMLDPEVRFASAAPMTFVGGRTSGGKALGVTTPMVTL